MVQLCVYTCTCGQSVSGSLPKKKKKTTGTRRNEKDVVAVSPFGLALVLRFVLIAIVVVELSTPFLLVVLRHATRRIVPSTCVVLKNTFFWFAPTDGDEEFSTWPVIDGIFVGGKDEPVSRKDSIPDVDTRRIRHSPPPAPTLFLPSFLSFFLENERHVVVGVDDNDDQNDDDDDDDQDNSKDAESTVETAATIV